MLCVCVRVLQHEACGTSSGVQTEPAGREDKDRRQCHPHMPRSGMSCNYTRTTCCSRYFTYIHQHMSRTVFVPSLLSPLSCRTYKICTRHSLHPIYKLFPCKRTSLILGYDQLGLWLLTARTSFLPWQQPESLKVLKMASLDGSNRYEAVKR